MTNKESENVFELQDVKFSRGERVILNGMNLKIRRGAITSIMGPSGTGKTTILRLLGGLNQPDSGQITYEGKDLTKFNAKALRAMRREVSMLFQNSGLFTSLSVFENVAFPIREHVDLTETMLRDLVLMKLQAVGLRGARDLLPRELSGGMARRAALARAIALDPNVIFYDEPFTGQDPISMGVILQLIRLLNDALQMTSVIVSHDIHEVFSISDYCYIIANGCVIAGGTPEELSREKNSHVAQFLQGLPDGPVSFHHPANDYYEDLIGS